MRWIVIIVLVLAGLGWAVWGLINPHSSEPIYQRRRLTAWLESCNDSWPESLPARNAVRAMGAKVIPYVHTRLQYRETLQLLQVKQWLNGFAKKHSLTMVHWQTAEEKYREGGRVYKYAEPSVRDHLIADWIHLVEDRPDTLRTWVQYQPTDSDSTNPLHEKEVFGPDAATPLAKALSNTNDYIRVTAVAFLRFVPFQRRMIVPALLEALHDKYSGVRGNAALSLGYFQREGVLGEDSDQVAAALLLNLKDTDDPTRRGAAVALGFFTNAAPLVTPALLKASEDKSVMVRKAAKEALKQIDPEAAAKTGLE
jgi:predicted alpha/beta hydrolase family esterase